jgi:hypothetical protein
MAEEVKKDEFKPFDKKAYLAEKLRKAQEVKK